MTILTNVCQYGTILLMENLTLQASIFSELVLEVFRVNRLLLDAGDMLTEPVGLNSARWQVLGVVEHGDAPVAHVARIMGLTRQAVQHTADNLEAEGLIVYGDNPHHRRAKLMVITPQGRKALDEVQQRHARWANYVAKDLAIDDLRAAQKILEHIRKRLENDVVDASNNKA
jgi:DNA-binding MarR family transcriptional regulator